MPAQKIRNDNIDYETKNIIDKNFIFGEYERAYISGRKSLPPFYFRGLSKHEKQERALSIIRFAIKNYLKWTPYDVKNYLTKEVLEKLKLTNLVKEYIEFPPEYKNSEDLTYLAYLLYPDKFQLSTTEQCMNMFKRIYRGEIKKYPSKWMNSNDGVTRLGILIRYVITQLPRFKNPEEMYEYFSSPNGIKVLKEYKLYTFAITLFPTAFSAVHYSLPSAVKSEFLYESQIFYRKTASVKTLGKKIMAWTKKSN